MTRWLLVLLCLVWAGAASAQASRARSIEDCEKIRAAHEYNLCLAAFSPRVGERRARVRGSARQERTAIRRGRGGREIARSRGGRQSATFEVRSSRRSARRR